MELLNGKAKKLFEEWYLSNHKHYDKLTVLDDGKLNQFYRLPDSMKNALIIEWFDSVGITVDTMPILDGKVKFQPNTFWLEKDIITEEIEYFETRQEATTEAIKKAVELINKDYEQSR